MAFIYSNCRKGQITNVIKKTSVESGLNMFRLGTWNVLQLRFYAGSEHA